MAAVFQRRALRLYILDLKEGIKDEVARIEAFLKIINKEINVPGEIDQFHVDLILTGIQRRMSLINEMKKNFKIISILLAA